MTKKAERQRRISDAFGRLAALFPYGALQEAMDPAGLIDSVIEEIQTLRGNRCEEQRLAFQAGGAWAVARLADAFEGLVDVPVQLWEVARPRERLVAARNAYPWRDVKVTENKKRADGKDFGLGEPKLSVD